MLNNQSKLLRLEFHFLQKKYVKLVQNIILAA